MHCLSELLGNERELGADLGWGLPVGQAWTWLQNMSRPHVAL